MSQETEKMRNASYLLADPGGEIVRMLLDRLEEARKALLPFARMHRKDSDPKEVACSRGAASDMTMITSGDFAEAARVLGMEDGAQ